MKLFGKNRSGISISRQEKYKRGFIIQSILVAISAVIVPPVLSYYFLSGENKLKLSKVSENMQMIDRDMFHFLWALFVILIFSGWLMSLSKYFREKGSRRGEEHGSSKLMTEKDMPRFRQLFFFDPKCVGEVKGFEKESKNTFWEADELKKVIRNTRALEREMNKNPLSPVKSSSEYRRRYKSSPGFRCFINSQIMAQDVYLSTNCKYINRNLNTITVGGSGQGKSFSELFPNVMLANSNYVITDPSGEILQKCGKFLRSQGYCIKVFNVKDFDMSMRYNPLMYIESEKDINVLVDALNKNIGGEKKNAGPNQFFEDAQMSLTAALFSALREIYPNNPEKQTLFNVMELLRMAEQKTDPETGEQYSELDTLFDELKTKNARSYAVKMYENFKVGGPKVCGSVIISATAVFGRFFDNDDMAKLVEADDLNLYDFATGVDENGDPLKCALFLVVPQDTTTYNFMVSMIYSQLFSIVTKGGEKWRLQHNIENPALPRHLSFWLDEFANVGKIPNFNEILSVVRKYNISINIIIQALSQLKSNYKDEWETILGNVDTLIYLGGQEPSTVKQMSEKLGKETIKTHSSSLSYGRGGNSESQQTAGRELLTTTEIEQMSRAYELVFITQNKPFKARKYDLTKHPNYNFFGEADPERNNLNITEFICTASDGNSLNEFRQIPMWKKTGNKDKFGVEIMRIVTEREPLLDNTDRLIRIDDNTIDYNDILKSISHIEDRIYNISKKVQSAKEAWKSAEDAKKRADSRLAKIRDEMQKKVPKEIFTKDDEEDANEEFTKASINASKKHILYLKLHIQEMEKEMASLTDNDAAKKISKSIEAEKGLIIQEEDNINKREKGEIEETKTVIPKDLRDFADSSSEIRGTDVPDSYKQKQKEAYLNFKNAQVNADLSDVNVSGKVVGVSGYNPYSVYRPAAEI